MRKRKILWATALVIALVLSVKYVNLSIDNYRQQKNAEMALKSNLSFAMSGFGIDFNTISDENQKEYYYDEAMSNIYSSSQLVGLTTYNSKNDGLDLALYNLYKLMEQNEYKNKVISKSKFIYENLLKLSHNPEDKEATDNIVKLTQEVWSIK